MNNCTRCGNEVSPGDRFCAQCGAPQIRVCPGCGHENPPGNRFCPACGTALAAPGEGSGSHGAAATVAERRLVSVLFADLVGFTTLSEHRDPEEVRELLSRYFDRCRTLIERYGGTVEKFIGDAVMAVWGSPVAREDDPERAVRAALGLVQEVATLGEEVGMPELRVRAGVLTGNAAVDVGSEAEGMVLGDTVNTASRLQSIAAPGTVLVDDATRRASEAAIAYEDAGSHALKGRDQPVRAWTALRVVAGVGGVRRSAGLEAPFVGRQAELERVVAASEEVASSGRARLIAVVGEAGAGKSRLLWEYYKYVDGVEKVVRWHQGRCLSYGEGVAYWALAEMVKARAGIIEEEDAASARRKLREAVIEHVPDEREQQLVEPRLAHLLGLEHRVASDRADLFSGWRLFFERLSEDAPVILAFEDLQWADSGLLDFIDYLLEWSADRPLFVLALGRPELLDARPAWQHDAIVLHPLPERAMREALAGLVPGLPEELSARILRQAEGVPLYAVETVRMLLDRGLLAQDGPRYVLTGPVGELDVPETLHALAAARLDGLSAQERAILQDAAVYGQSFTPGGVAALGSRASEDVKRLLDGLVAKQILGFDDNPLSAERGQYHFLQGLLRTTAYGTLSRRDRKNRHLAAARHLQETWGEDAPELAEVLAAHFLDAANAEPEAGDAPRIRAAACDTLVEAGRRALSLALGAEGQRAFERAAELADSDERRAELLHQAGRAALLNADFDVALDRLRQAVEIFERLDDHESAAKVIAAIAHSLAAADRLDEALELSRRALTGLADGTVEKAAALSALARNLVWRGETSEAFDAADAALSIAEPLQEWPIVVEAFNNIAVIRSREGRIQEGIAFRERSLALSLEHGLTESALRTYNNLADVPLQQDRYAECAEIAERGLELARSRGDRRWEQTLILMLASAKVAGGDWDALPPLLEDGLPQATELLRLAYLPLIARIQAGRGQLAALERTLELATERVGSTNVEFGSSPAVAQAIALRAMGRDAEALRAALPVAVSRPSIANEDRREAYLEAGLAALTLGDEATVQRLVEYVAELPPAMRSPLLRAAAERFAGLIAFRRGDLREADARLSSGIREIRTVESPFNLAQMLLERAEILAAGDETDVAPLISDARALFTRLGATPWLERVTALGSAVPA